MAAIDFDELDLAIVDAVRTAPRASWSDLGSALGVNPSTVSRRWSRMESSGAAWVTAHPSGGAMPVCALVEIDCEPGRSMDVARDLALDREAASIKVTSGPRDLVVRAQALSLQALSGYLLGLVPRIDGIARVRSHIFTRSTLDVSRWRDGSLDAEQQRRLGSPPAGIAEAGVLDTTNRLILAALHADGRMSLEGIAEFAGVGALAVRRRLTHMRNGGLVTLRCDVSHELSGRSVWAMYFGSLNVQDLRSAEQRIRVLPGVRAASFTAGPFNVVVDAWLHSTAEVHDLEWRMSRELPELSVLDRSVVLRTTKLLGRVLDADGRAIGVVPLLPDDSQE